MKSISSLAGITGLPSDMLGVLVGLEHRGIHIRLFNVTPDVRLILETTNLDRVFKAIADLELPRFFRERDEKVVKLEFRGCPRPRVTARETPPAARRPEYYAG